RLVATTEGSRPKDIRDRAILLLLAVYALRSGEVRALRLEDLDWEKGLLFVPRAKGRKREPYPLSPTVGQAIIRYLKEARPRSSGSSEPQPARSAMKLAQLIVQYVAFRKSLGQDFESNRKRLRAFSRFVGESVATDSVKPSQVAAFNYAITRGYLSTSPLPAT